LKKITLIIEKSHHGFLWGRIKYKNNLLVEKASSVTALERRMKKLLSDFHGLELDKIEFYIAYDLGVFFEQKDFLNISGIAKMANINASLLRQYAAGIKFPSPEKAAEIEGVIRRIGNELSLINISARVREGEERRNKMGKLSLR
jgi:hypothetical protein